MAAARAGTRHAFGGRKPGLKSLLTAVFIFVYNARVAPVAQLDRVPPSEGGGRGFESRLVHHIPYVFNDLHCPLTR